MRTALGLLAFPLLLAAPASASNGKTPPGNPCAKGNGNPCKGNNGNSGAQGNSGKESVQYGTPSLIDNNAPTFTGRGAYITQIGSANIAAVRQTSTLARADVAQRGDRNVADVEQRGTNAAYVSTFQLGDANHAGVIQGGVGPNTLFVMQNGARNAAVATQTSQGALYNGAVITQLGEGNRIALAQSGEDNRAVLTQDGDDNRMTATQYGAGNRLAWTQQGAGLSDLGIEQTGGHAISIVQTGGR